jgi:hypothetical protein
MKQMTYHNKLQNSINSLNCMKSAFRNYLQENLQNNLNDTDLDDLDKYLLPSNWLRRLKTGLFFPPDLKMYGYSCLLDERAIDRSPSRGCIDIYSAITPRISGFNP